MKSLLLVVVLVFSSNAHAESFTDINREVKITVNEISEYYCQRANVIAIQPCVEEFNKCLIGIAFDRIKISQSIKLLNAMTFCNNSLTEI